MKLEKTPTGSLFDGSGVQTSVTVEIASFFFLCVKTDLYLSHTFIFSFVRVLSPFTFNASFPLLKDKAGDILSILSLLS